MLSYVLKRLVGVVITFFIVIAVVFFVVHSMPGSIIDDPMIKDEVRRAIEAKYHLNEPMPVQFAYFIQDYLHLDFGDSLLVRPKTAVVDIIKERLPITIQLNLFAALFTLPMGLFFGISMALKKNTVYDAVTSSVVIFFISAPSFIVASLLQYILGFKLGVLPAMLAPIVGLNWEKFKSMILPILALSFGNIASISRMLRAELSETMSSDYLLLAKAKGLTYRQTITRHALRNACVPMAAQFMYLFIYLISGSIVIENIFNVPGLSQMLVASINGKDHQLTLGIVYFYVIIGLVLAIAADLSYGVLDPRIRMGGKKE